MEIIRAYHDKKRKELWCKALGKQTFEQCLAQAPPKRKSNNDQIEFVPISELKKGKYNLQKVPHLALEVQSVETVGNCF